MSRQIRRIVPACRSSGFDRNPRSQNYTFLRRGQSVVPTTLFRRPVHAIPYLILFHLFATVNDWCLHTIVDEQNNSDTVQYTSPEVLWVVVHKFGLILRLQ